MNALDNPIELLMMPRSARRTGTAAVGMVIGDGAAVITTGLKGFYPVPFSGVITGVTVLSSDAAVTAGSIVIDIWKAPIAAYPPTAANSITAAARPTLAAAIKSVDTTLLGWIKTITAGDVLGFTVISAAAVTRVTIGLSVQS